MATVSNHWEKKKKNSSRRRDSPNRSSTRADEGSRFHRINLSSFFDARVRGAIGSSRPVAPFPRRPPGDQVLCSRPLLLACLRKRRRLELGARHGPGVPVPLDMRAGSQAFETNIFKLRQATEEKGSKRSCHEADRDDPARARACVLELSMVLSAGSSLRRACSVNRLAAGGGGTKRNGRPV